MFERQQKQLPQSGTRTPRADRAAQMKVEAERRLESQRVRAIQTTAKIARLKALRMERDAQEARVLAETLANAPAPAPKRRASRAKAAVEA